MDLWATTSGHLLELEVTDSLKMGVVVCAYNPISLALRWEGGEFKVRMDYSSRMLFQAKPETNKQTKSKQLPGLWL